MKLSGSEATDLLRALLAAFPDRDRLRLVVGKTPVERNYDQIVPRSTLEPEYFALVQAANNEGWIDALVAGLRAAERVSPLLLAVLDGFARTRPKSVLPPHLDLVLDGAPFVNQHPLRTALSEMTQGFGARVLQVTGERCSGKSYSQYLITHVARRTGASVYPGLSLEATTTARDVVEDIALWWRIDPPPASLTADLAQDSTVVMRLVRWLAAQGQTLDRDWWLIMDGFDSPRVHDSVTMLMTGLAQTIGMGQLDRLRLFLLAWNRPISGPPPGRVFEQGLAAFERGHLKAWLDDLVAQFAMPDSFASTDELLDLCYTGWTEAADPLDRAVALTQRIQKVAAAALAARQAQP
ncbi:MAG: effector-associated domain EAD1-containing protein [Paracoccaceae bacterium]